MNIQTKILDKEFFDEFKIFEQATEGAAAFDLRANIKEEELVLYPGEAQLIPTGFAIWIKEQGVVGKIYPRSGSGHKRGLVLGNGTGVIDSDYQGELFVSLCNRTDNAQKIKRGERIAQLTIERVIIPEFNIVEDFEDSTERGEGGFGSTGTK